MTQIEQDIITAINDHYGEEMCFVRDERSGCWQISAEDVTVRIADDDGTAFVYVFENSARRNMVLQSEARFTHMPANVVALIVCHHLDTALESV